MLAEARTRFLEAWHLGSEKQFSDLAAEDTGRWMAGWR